MTFDDFMVGLAVVMVVLLLVLGPILPILIVISIYASIKTWRTNRKWKKEDQS